MTQFELLALVAAAGLVAFALFGRSGTGPARGGRRPGRVALDALDDVSREGAAAIIEQRLGRVHARRFLADLADLADEDATRPNA